MLGIKKVFATGLLIGTLTLFGETVEARYAGYLEKYPEAVKDIEEEMLKVEETIYFDSGKDIESKDFHELVGVIRHSNPDIMYVKTWSYWRGSGSLEIEYKKPVEQIKKEREILHREADKVLNKIIKPNATDFEKVLAIQNYVVQNVEYSKEYLAGKDSPNVHEAYGALIEGQAVCGGYALLTKLFLDKLGMENHYILGYTGGVYHAWNMVKVDGEFYYMDTTWDDPTSNKGSELQYKYFLTSESELRRTHTWDKTGLPKTGDKYKYLRNMSTYGKNELQVKDGYVYCSTVSKGQELYRIKLDGTGKQKLTLGRAPYFVILGNKAYLANYSQGGVLYEIGIKGAKNAKMVVRDHVRDLKVKNGKIEYYSVDKGKTMYYTPK